MATYQPAREYEIIRLQGFDSDLELVVPELLTLNDGDSAQFQIFDQSLRVLVTKEMQITGQRLYCKFEENEFNNKIGKHRWILTLTIMGEKYPGGFGSFIIRTKDGK